MDVNYLYDSIKNYYDNESLHEKVAALQNQAISTAIKQGDLSNTTKLHIYFEDAVKAGQVDAESFEII